MTILGIETSCDETGAAIIEGEKESVKLLSNIVASSLAMHAQTGGIIPERAAREQVKFMLPVLKEALQKADKTLDDLDGIAVTYGPGLIGSLLVGVETAKTLAYVTKKPLIPVNHMVGHIYANWINTSEKQNFSPRTSHFLPPTFPAVVLVVSGGHTDLLLMKKHGEFQLLGGTRDDAAGEAYDKIGRLLGLPYPAGPRIEQLAKEGNPKRFRFPRPLLHEDTFEFSFSGLKTAVLREVQKMKTIDEATCRDIARATQDAICEVLVKKTLRAAKDHGVNTIMISGGVAASQTLRENFSLLTSHLSLQFFAPAKNLCTDNAAMIASAAYFNFKPVPWPEVTADPELYF